MGLFNWSKKKEAPHAFLWPYFDEVLKLLVDFNISDSLEDEDRCGFVELMTSSSALVTASYHMKYYMAYKGKIDQKVATEIGTNITNFFRLTSEATLLAAEKETGKKYDRENWFENTTRVQSEKLKKYAQAILRTIEKGRGITTGADISNSVTDDLYGEEVTDLMLGVGLWDIVSRVKK